MVWLWAITLYVIALCGVTLCGIISGDIALCDMILWPQAPVRVAMRQMESCYGSTQRWALRVEQIVPLAGS